MVKLFSYHVSNKVVRSLKWAEKDRYHCHALIFSDRNRR